MICSLFGGNALRFGARYEQEFRQRTNGLSCHEIPLFRAMHQSLIACARHDFAVEEYHGAKHQVRFVGNGSYARSRARCELSDLMVLIYGRQARAARLTYIQAKSERKVLANGATLIGSRLAANLEQWHLLSARPPIQGVGQFDPPPDLLSSAQLASVGAFAFFLKDAYGEFETYYGAANALTLGGQYGQRFGTLVAGMDLCRCSPEPECLSVYGNRQFATALYAMMIGTPVWPVTRATQSTSRWLSGVLRAQAQAGVGGQGELALELAGLLNDDVRGNDSVASGAFGAAHLIIIRSDDNHEPNRRSRGIRAGANG